MVKFGCVNLFTQITQDKKSARVTLRSKTKENEKFTLAIIPRQLHESCHWR